MSSPTELAKAGHGAGSLLWGDIEFLYETAVPYGAANIKNAERQKE